MQVERKPHTTSVPFHFVEPRRVQFAFLGGLSEARNTHRSKYVHVGHLVVLAARDAILVIVTVL